MIAIPNKFLNDPEWHLVEQCVREAFEEVAFLPDSSTNPTDFKAQVLANVRIKKALESLLAQTGIVKKLDDDKNPFV